MIKKLSETIFDPITQMAARIEAVDLCRAAYIASRKKPAVVRDNQMRRAEDTIGNISF